MSRVGGAAARPAPPASSSCTSWWKFWSDTSRQYYLARSTPLKCGTALAQQEADVVFLRFPVTDDIEVRYLPARRPFLGDPVPAHAGSAPGHPGGQHSRASPSAVVELLSGRPPPRRRPRSLGLVVTDMESLLHTVAAGEAMCFLPSAARDGFENFPASVPGVNPWRIFRPRR